MSHLLLLPLLLAAAPAEEPDPEPDPRPEKAVAAFDKAVRDPKAKAEDLDKRRKVLAEKLKKASAALEKRGKKDEADRVNDYAVLLESIKPTADLGKITAAEALKAGSVKAKYKRLLHVLHIPGDLASYTEFKDWGHYTGTSYHGFTDLKPGYWVYAYPRWYIWEKQP
ncbi:MAG: hypothetical protein K2W96_10105 [Gemmataceae bacterium]|nr:hypothetical protein [Gemmataceae bacterium]